MMCNVSASWWDFTLNHEILSRRSKMAIWGQVRIIISTRLWGRGTVATEIGFLYFLLWNFEVLCKDPIPRAGRSLIFGWHSLHACTRAYVRRALCASRTRVLQLTTRHLGKTQPKLLEFLIPLGAKAPRSNRQWIENQTDVMESRTRGQLAGRVTTADFGTKLVASSDLTAKCQSIPARVRGRRACSSSQSIL